MLGHLLRVFGKGRAFSRGQVVHPDPVALDADLFEQLVNVADTLPATEVALIVVAVALEATDAENTVGAFLKAPEQIDHIHFAGTGDAENFYVCGVG